MGCIFSTEADVPKDIKHNVDHTKLRQEVLDDAEDQLAKWPAPFIRDQMAELIIQFGYITSLWWCSCSTIT
eukprot:UN17156